MAQTIEALFDGRVFRPAEPVGLEPNTRVQITVKVIVPAETGAFLRTARSLNLEGPDDWSQNLDRYLYSRDPEHER
jgi:predicted DNA-binding antitoxin AbrB/MazE fold protein